MKQILLLLTAFLVFWGCSENGTGSGDDNEANTFISSNVKTEGNTYFTFATNSGSSTEPAEWDLAFSSVPFTVDIGQCQFLTINDPVILFADGISVAKVDAATLDDVNEIPDAGLFQTDNAEPTPVVGENWLATGFMPTMNVYAIKTCPGNYALVQFVDYTYTGSPLHQLEDIKWLFKFNSDGSTDFSATAADSFVAVNAYTNKQYFSFLNGNVTVDEASDLVLNGYSIELGNGVQIKNLGVTDLQAVTTITDEAWETDQQAVYITLGWYNYGEDHTLTARDYVYVVNTSDNKYAAFEIINYYNEMGESGVFTINWKYLD